MARRRHVAADNQRDMLPLEHRSLHMDRVKQRAAVNPEAIWLREWQALHKRINNLLGHILAPPPPAHRAQFGRIPIVPSRRDAVVAASVVQWLATNVGQSFVVHCQRIVQQADARAHTVGYERSVQRMAAEQDQRTPLQRRRDLLAAVRARLAAAARTGGSQ